MGGPAALWGIRTPADSVSRGPAVPGRRATSVTVTAGAVHARRRSRRSGVRWRPRAPARRVRSDHRRPGDTRRQQSRAREALRRREAKRSQGPTAMTDESDTAKNGAWIALLSRGPHDLTRNELRAVLL